MRSVRVSGHLPGNWARMRRVFTLAGDRLNERGEMKMTDEQNTDPTLEQLRAIENEVAVLLAEFFAERDIHTAVGLSVLTSLVGRGLNTFSAPEDMERSLATVFKSIRFRAMGEQTADVPAH